MDPVLGLGGCPGGGNGNSLQYSCLENPMGRGAWRATVHKDCKAEPDCTAEHAHTQNSLAHLADRR